MAGPMTTHLRTELGLRPLRSYGEMLAYARSVVTPYAPNDQPAWAERVAALGVGLRLPGFKRLSAERLAQAIDTAVNDAALRARAAALGEKIRAEDGVARAVEIIERHAEET